MEPTGGLGRYLDAYCQFMNSLETLIGELEKKATFTDPSVADDDVFEEVSITHKLGLVTKGRH